MRARIAVLLSVAALTLGVVTVAGGGGTTHAATCTVSSLLVPSCGAWWGATSPDRGIPNYETLIGRQVDVPQYFLGSKTALSDEAVQEANLGKYLRVDYTGITHLWKDIASGGADADVHALAASLKAIAPHKVLFSFFHEPENNIGKTTGFQGTAADYVHAYQHIHQVFAADGVTNVVWVWAIMGFPGWYSLYPSKLYPGDAYVDWISFDPYNWYTCHHNTWKTFSQIVSPFYTWLEQNGRGGKPFLLSEYGTPEGPKGASKANWFAGIVPALKTSFPNVKALIYFDEARPDSNGQFCDFRVDTTAKSLASWQTAGADPYVNQTRT